MTITIIIASMILICYMLIATERITGINKAAVAMFGGTLGWVLYVCYGEDFVMAQHPDEFQVFLAGAPSTSSAVKDFIYDNIFIQYIGKAAEIVLFLIATMTIVELLNNNGCFDFLTQWFRSRNSRWLLLWISAFTFFVSANLDNLTTATMMLAVMHTLIPRRKQRMVIGTAIVVSANIGGALTVIGDTNGLMLWHLGAVTPSHFSAWMFLPCMVAWGVTIALLSRMMPERIDLERVGMPYRGDDTNLNTWQRVLMFAFAICGLWFIPTFHNITHLSPFLGALCALSLIWVINELFNSRLYVTRQRVERRMPLAMQYTMLQTLLFVMGIMLCTSVLLESGGTVWFGKQMSALLGDWFYIYVAPMIAGIVSLFLDTFATASAFFTLFQVSGTEGYLALNGEYWILIAYTTALGGTIISIGSLSGIALMKMEDITIGQFIRQFSPKILIGVFLGMAVLIAEVIYF